MSEENKPILDMSEEDEENVSVEEDAHVDDHDENPPAAAYTPDHLADSEIMEDDDADDDESQPDAPAQIPPKDFADAMMSPAIAAMMFAGCAALLLAGWLFHTASAIPNFILALLFSTASLTVFRSLKTKRWILHSFLLVGVSVLYIFGLFLFHKVWISNFESFGEHVVGLTQTTGKAISSGSVEDSKAVEMPVRIAGDSITAALGFLHISAKNKFMMFFQLVAFSAMVFLFSLTVVHATPGLGKPIDAGGEKGIMAWFGPTAHRCINAIGAFALARIIKALVICMVCGVGLRMAGIQLAPFIAGTVFCFALVSYLSPAVALVLGGIAIWAVGWNWSSIGGLIVVCIVLALAEKALFWLLKRIPLFRGFVSGPGQRTGAIGKTMGVVSRAMPHVLSLATLGLLVYFVVTVYGVYTNSLARDKVVKEADNLFKTQDWQGAFDSYSKTYSTYPDHPGNARMAVNMLKCRLKQERLEQAKHIAEILAKRKSATDPLPQLQDMTDVVSVREGSEHLVSRFKYEMYKFLSTQSDDVSLGKGYELIIREVHGEDHTQLLGELGSKLIAVDENNPWGYIGASRASLQQEDGQQALAFSRSGLGKEPDMRELLLLQGEAYFLLGQFDECISRCKVVLESDKLDDDASVLFARAVQARSEGAEEVNEKTEDEDPVDVIEQEE